MNRNTVKELLRLCAYLIKASCVGFFGLLIFALLSWVFGVGEIGVNLLIFILPKLGRIVVLIECLLVVTAISTGL